MQPVILVIDDNHALRQALPTWLTTLFPHCRVVTARTGMAGLRAARRHGPRLVVTDIRLRTLDGMEVARRIKARKPDTGVVIFTFCDGDSYRTEATQAGVNGYVLKNRAQTDLAPVLRRLFGLAAAGTPCRLRGGTAGGPA